MSKRKVVTNLLTLKTHRVNRFSPGEAYCYYCLSRYSVLLSVMSYGNQTKSRYLTGVRAFILPFKSRKLQLMLWRTNLTDAGGEISAVYDEQITHVIVGVGYSSSTVLEQLKSKNISMYPENNNKLQPKVVSHFWLSTCFQKQKFQDEDGFCIFDGETKHGNAGLNYPSTTKPDRLVLNSARNIIRHELSLHSYLVKRDLKTWTAKIVTPIHCQRERFRYDRNFLIPFEG